MGSIFAIFLLKGSFRKKTYLCLVSQELICYNERGVIIEEGVFFNDFSKRFACRYDLCSRRQTN